MDKGYVIIVKDYKAEICEFITIAIGNMPDNSKLYFVHTKYGDDYFNEQELKANRTDLEKECDELNKVLEKSIHVASRDKKNRW